MKCSVVAVLHFSKYVAVFRLEVGSHNLEISVNYSKKIAFKVHVSPLLAKI